MERFSGPARVGVVSSQQLVMQAVRLLLHAAHREVTGILWRPPEALQPSVRARFDVGLLLADLATQADVQAAALLVEESGHPWLVITDRPTGPAWGALLVRGRVLVRGAHCGADEVLELVDELADPLEEFILGPGELDLMADWTRWQTAAEDFRRRLATLSRREEMVLRLMDQGASVTEMATILGVAPGTVRTQVKSLRRKLGAGSQLAAIADLHRYGEAQWHGEWEAYVDAPSLPRPRRALADRPRETTGHTSSSQ